MKNINTLIISILVSTIILQACKTKKNENPAPETPSYSIPATYNGYSNVDHTESTTIIGMYSELSSQIAAGTGTAPTTVPTPLDIQHLKDLFKNQNSPFTNAAYNTSGFQIESNCLASSQLQLESFLDSLVVISNSGTSASSGVAGLGLSNDATPRRFLLSANGINYSQMFSKNLMCDLIYYQISTRISNYNLDNTVLITGPDGIKKYTAMEHNWDEAFGYWSVPDSFPLVKTPLKLWGSYSNQVDAGLHCNGIVMNAFLKGRAAISNKDMTTVKEQAEIIIAEFDLMTAGAVCQELNEVQLAVNASDIVKVLNALSECKAFVMSMKNNKNPNRIITDAQIDTLLSYFPDNFWNVTQADLDNIRAYICSVYGFSHDQSLIL